MSADAAGLLLAWVAILILTLALAGVIRQLRTMQQSLGYRRPVQGPDMESVDFSALGEDVSVVVFVSDTCATCQEILAWSGRNRAAIAASQVAFVAREPTSGPDQDMVIVNRTLFDMAGVRVTPLGVRVATEAGNGAEVAPLGSLERFKAFVGLSEKAGTHES